MDLLKYETELKYDASEVKGSSVIADHMHKQGSCDQKAPFM